MPKRRLPIATTGLGPIRDQIVVFPWGNRRDWLRDRCGARYVWCEVLARGFKSRFIGLGEFARR